MKYIIAVLAIISLGGFGLFTYLNDDLAVGGGTGTLNQLNQWRSDGGRITQNTIGTILKLTGYESSGDCLVTNASGIVSTSTCGGGGSSKWTDGGSVIYPTGGESVAVSSIAATGTATSTFTRLSVSTALNLFGTIGTALSDFCVAITGGAGLCDGTDATGGGGSGSNWDIVSGGLETATTTDFARASYFVASSTTGTSTFANAVQIGSTARGNALAITAVAASPSSDSVGGLTNITNTNNLASALTIYSNAGVGRTNDLLRIKNDNILNDQRGLSIQNDGTRSAGLFDCTNATRVSGGECVNITDASGANRTTLGVSGAPIGLGLLKFTVNSGADANASALSVQLDDTDPQGIFLDTVAGYTGKFFNIRNNGTELFTLNSSGFLGLGTSSPASKLSVVGDSGSTAPTFSVASSTNAALFTVMPNGNVGIATTTPATALSVVGTTTTSNLSIGSLTGFLKAATGAVTTSLISLTSDITGILGISNGGTGTSTAPTTDQILVGNSGGSYDYRRITAGSNVTVSTSTAGQIQISSTGGSSSGLSTTSPWTNGNLAYVTGLGSVGSVATGTLTETVTGLELSATRALVGGTAILAITSGYEIPLSASTTQWAGFYNTPSTRITAGTGIDWSGNTLNGVYTAGDALTLTGEDFDFDGGATPQGELGGTWASPTIDDGLAVTNWNLTTPTLTSFFGTPCTTGEFLTDIADNGTFTCAAGGSGGGGGGLSTTTDTIGAGGAQEVAYVQSDVMFGGNSSTTAEFQFDDDGGQFIISSTSNTNATATIESNNDAQAVRIGDDIGSGLEYIFSTVGDAIIRGYGAVTEMIVAIAETLFQGNVRITGDLHVATTTYYGATTTDALVIDGFTNSGEWIQEFCTTPTGETTAVVADTLRGCGRYNYSEDAAGQLDFVVPTTGTSTYFNLQPGVTGAINAAGDGMGINWASGIDFGDIQRHSPAMEFAIRQDTVNNATGTTIQAGITSAITVNPDFAAEPAQGFYVLSTTTQANYLLACNPSTGNTTYVDTGIASSTTATANANPFTHFRLEISGTSNTAVTAILKARIRSNQVMTTVGSCTLNLSASTQAVAPVVGIGKSGVGTGSDLHLMFLKFWYKQPVF